MTPVYHAVPEPFNSVIVRIFYEDIALIAFVIIGAKKACFFGEGIEVHSKRSRPEFLENRAPLS